jgi:hypothetical protein
MNYNIKLKTEQKRRKGRKREGGSREKEEGKRN